MSKPPPISDSEFDTAYRKGATDDEIEAKLNGAWRLVLWPPVLNADPAFWPDYDLLWE